MSDCGICQTKTSRYDDLLHCSGDSCNRICHITCVGINLSQFTEMKADGKIKLWKCPNCSNPSHEMEQRLKCFIKEAFTDIKKEITSVKDSQNFISTQYDQVMKKLDEVVNLKQQVIDLETKLMDKNKQIESLETRITQLEQYGRRRQFEICSTERK